MVETDTVRPALAERPLVLALDIGSSSMRGAVHDRRGRTLRGTGVQVKYAWTTAPGGSVRLPFEAFAGLLGETLDQLEAAAGPLAGEVVAGGISCFVHSIVGLDASGRPVTPVLSWADTSSANEAQGLRERVEPDAMHAATGAPIHAGYWPARIGRLRREEPGIRRWSGLAELLVETLTGQAAVSRSMASGTGLLERARGTWAATWLRELAIDAEQLPAIIDDNQPVGRLYPAAARRWPRLSRVVWFAAWADGGCGNVGLGAVGRGRAALMVGTSGAVRTVLDDAGLAVPLGLFAQRLGTGTVVGAQLSEGGGTLAWASTLLGQRPAALERAAGAPAYDDHGLTVLPFVFGERGLGYHDDARGSVAGLAAGTDGPAIYRAIVESVAFSFAAADEKLTQVLGSAPEVVASGGALVASPLLVQALADALGRDIGVAPALEASRRGAALLALWGDGHLADPWAAPAPRTSVVTSHPARTAHYRAARERRDEMYRTLIA